MRLPGLCVARPVATILLTAGLALAGIGAFLLLPVAPLPQVDSPTISIQASMPGASPETMATSVAGPLERHLGSIADVSEMTSSSSVGSTRITLQFGLNRDIDGAARDVQAAIVAARADLPTSLRSNPTYRKVNPADAPIMLLSLTSATRTAGQVYDAAATVLQQKLSQVSGIGQVIIGGSSLPAVRVALDTQALSAYGIGMEDVRAALAAVNANAPKGAIEADGRRWQIATNDRAAKADEYRDLILAWRNGRGVRLGDIATVTDGVEDQRNLGLADGKPAVLLILFRQPGANVITVVDAVRSLVPELQTMIPQDIDLGVVMDRTTTIRASLRDVERTLAIAIALVVVVVWTFLRSPGATLIPVVVVPVSLLGTFAAMWLCGFSLDNLSLMALIVATGFVVDDAVVVLENAARHVEAGVPPVRAALRSAREVGFTVISMSLSLVAVFLPVLLMGGFVGRLFREFAVVLAISILVSMVISLTVTPMMCARMLRQRPVERVGERTWGGRWWAAVLDAYRRTLGAALRHPGLTLLALGGVIAANIWLFIAIPKGFFPQQDTGRLMGSVQADQAISFQAMQEKLAAYIRIMKKDPAIERVVGFTGGGATNSANIFAVLKPVAERDVTSDEVTTRLRPQLARVPGASLFLVAPQDIRTGGRMSNAQWQYTLQADDLSQLRTWTPRLAEALKTDPRLTDVNADLQERGQELRVTIDRDAAIRVNLTPVQIDNALYDAFGQRQVSTIYNQLNQYHVVMEADHQAIQRPEALGDLRISTAGGALGGTQATAAIATSNAAGATTAVVNQRANQLGNAGRGSNTGTAVSTAAETMVPLTTVAKIGYGVTPLAVNHQGNFAATTISFNLASGAALTDAVTAVEAASARIDLPATVHGSFAGTAKTFQQSQSNQGFLIIAAILAIYVVLGVLYESWIHPVTILSTLPSAGVGAVLALMWAGIDFSLISLIGVFLLIGIVKKNAIMMVDVAIDLQRHHGFTAFTAIEHACLLRFRPILMTTLVAIAGALPLALGHGDGAELRRPLGITIVGGLIVSQLLTLYTTPVVYLCLDRLRRRQIPPVEMVA
jgi:multidrug efflux pump